MEYSARFVLAMHYLSAIKRRFKDIANVYIYSQFQYACMHLCYNV